MAEQTSTPAPVAYPVPAAGVIGNRIVRDVATAGSPMAARRPTPKVRVRSRALPKGH